MCFSTLNLPFAKFHTQVETLYYLSNNEIMLTTENMRYKHVKDLSIYVHRELNLVVFHHRFGR